MALSNKLPPRILVIESDEALSVLIANSIERGLLNVSKASSEEMAIKLVISNVPNIAIISSRMKDISALEMANKLRKVTKLVNLPLIFLIEESEVVANYNMKDNEFIEIISRPFTPYQLMTGIKSLLRKSQPIFQDKLIKYKDVSIDLATYKVFKGQKAIHLGPTEFKILQLFMQSPRVIFSREQIINYVWGENKNIELRTVDVHVNRLRSVMNVPSEPKNHNNVNISENTSKIRSMIKAAPHDTQFIKTVRSSGYCLNLPGEID